MKPLQTTVFLKFKAETPDKTQVSLLKYRSPGISMQGNWKKKCGIFVNLPKMWFLTADCPQNNAFK